MTVQKERKVLYVALTNLRDSKHNPRTRYDDEYIKGLAASITANGVLNSLIVRPMKGGTFEIGAGHCRFRAAKLAGLESVPCDVRDLDDKAFIELLNVENLQRRDIHPLEEASGFRSMMEECGYKPTDLAARIGKPEHYIHDRLRLLNLTKQCKDLFYAGRITLGHAILLARIPADRQKECVEDERGGLFQREQSDTLGLGLKDTPQKACSVNELKYWIDRHVRLDLTDEAAPELFAQAFEAVAALNPADKDKAKAKREKLVDITYLHYTNPEVRDDKRRIFGPMSWMRADGKEKSKTCDRSVLGVIVVGPNRGEAFRVCLDRKNCAVHFSQPKGGKTDASNVGGSRKAEKDSYAEQQAKRQAAQKAHEALRARFEKAEPALRKAFAEKMKKAPAKLVALHVLAQFNSTTLKMAMKDLPAWKTADDLLRVLAMVAVVDSLDGWHVAENAPRLGKSFGVDVLKIVDKVAPAPKPEPAPAPEKKPEPKKLRRATV